jgi:hypothetical protein
MSRKTSNDGGKTKLTEADHILLSHLIRGLTMEQAAEQMKSTVNALGRRLFRMRVLLECNTTYQLIALEMVFLIGEAGEPAPFLPPSGT